jgi:hypothetical protein
VREGHQIDNTSKSYRILNSHFSIDEVPETSRPCHENAMTYVIPGKVCDEHERKTRRPKQKPANTVKSGWQTIGDAPKIPWNNDQTQESTPSSNMHGTIFAPSGTHEKIQIV